MKYLVFIITLFIFNVANGQDLVESEIPGSVTDAVESEYNDATDVEWKRNGDLYEVEFDVDGVDHKMLIDATGEVIESREEILASDLPSSVLDALNAQYADREIDDVEKIERDGEETYEVEFKGLFDTKVTVTSDGEIRDE